MDPSEPLTASGKHIIEQTKLGKDIIFSNLFKYTSKNNYIDIAIPLYLNPENHDGYSGVALLHINPEKYLYPLILSWPSPSHTSEFLLVYKTGDSVQFFSKLQYNKNIALPFRKPMTDTLLLAVQAINGKTGILEGIDYRGNNVLGDARPVPGSPWFVIAKVDIDEFYHPIVVLAIWIFVITFLLIMISALIIYVVWKQQLTKLEMERQAIQKHFDYVIKYANDIICLADLDGNIYEVNDKAVNTYGYSREKLLKLNLNQLRPTETNEAFDQLLTLLNEIDGYIYETIHVKKNGEIFPVEVSGIITDIMGVQYIQLIIRNITERNLAIEKLRASEDGFRTLAESMPQFVWIAQADGMISWVNQRWEEFTGLTREDSYDTGWIKPFHPDDKQRVLDAWNLATETGGRYNIECRLQQYDGEYHWFVIQGEPLRDSSGDIIRWHGTGTGIDSQKQIQKEIKQLNDELEAFSFSAAHDLRSPLQNIDGWGLALLESYYDQLDVKGREFLERIRKETFRMKNLIDDFFKLSHVSLTDLIKVDVDLTSLARDIINRLMKDSTDRQIEIIIQPGMVTFGDVNMLEIALTNLLDNAYKYNGKQPNTRIEFSKSIIKSQPTYWVQDNGVGFDMANSKNLFGAFQRMHKQSEFPGTGIGLATVQRIIHRHEGQIWAESKINQGATFYFTLPENKI